MWFVTTLGLIGFLFLGFLIGVLVTFYILREISIKYTSVTLADLGKNVWEVLMEQTK